MNLSTLSRSLVSAAALALFSASAAYADSDIFTVQLQAPTSETTVAARNTVWTCEGEICRARPNHAVSVSACRALAREVGPVASYGTDERQLTEEQLAACNSSARTSSTQQAQN